MIIVSWLYWACVCLGRSCNFILARQARFNSTFRDKTQPAVTAISTLILSSLVESQAEQWAASAIQAYKMKIVSV